MIIHRQFEISTLPKSFICILYGIIYLVTQTVQTLIGVNQRMFNFFMKF
jgi:hypothetical protein